jgi:hypothetical protein
MHSVFVYPPRPFGIDACEGWDPPHLGIGCVVLDDSCHAPLSFVDAHVELVGTPYAVARSWLLKFSGDDGSQQMCEFVSCTLFPRGDCIVVFSEMPGR